MTVFLALKDSMNGEVDNVRCYLNLTFHLREKDKTEASELKKCSLD